MATDNRLEQRSLFEMKIYLSNYFLCGKKDGKPFSTREKFIATMSDGTVHLTLIRSVAFNGRAQLTNGHVATDIDSHRLVLCKTGHGYSPAELLPEIVDTYDLSQSTVSPDATEFVCMGKYTKIVFQYRKIEDEPEFVQYYCPEIIFYNRIIPVKLRQSAL